MADLEYVRVEWDAELAVVTIDRPDKLNALNAEVVQEIGDCGERVLLTADNGQATKRAAVADFIELFEPGDVVESAYRADVAADGPYHVA